MNIRTANQSHASLVGIVLLALVLLSGVATRAQAPNPSTVGVTFDGASVHVNGQGDIGEMRIEVANEASEIVFESGAIYNPRFDWNMKDSLGERVAPGTYLVTVTFRNATGKLRKQVEQVTVTEDEKSNTQALAAPAPNATLATISGSGTINRIAKFTGAATIGDSIITESKGRIGIGATDPQRALQIGPSSDAAFTFEPSDVSPNAGYIRFGDNTGWKLHFARSRESSGGALNTGITGYVMTIQDNGNVGIGTFSPTTKLEVRGGTGHGVYASTVGFGPGVNAVWGIGHGYATGVAGESTGGGPGVYGRSTNGYAGYFEGKTKITGTLEAVGCFGCDPPSNRNLKTNFSVVNPRFILDRLVSIPIQTWNYKSEPETVRHLGVMAQDFRAAFNLGKDDKTLNTVDAQGVTMAAIQGLHQLSREQQAQIADQQKQLKRQQKEINGLKALVCQSNPQAALCLEK